MLIAPRALLLDFGGVLADAPAQPPAPPELVDRLFRLVEGAVPADRIARDLTDGHRSYARWRDDVGRTGDPIELRHDQVWADFVTTSWPPPAQAAVHREATPLAYAWTWRAQWAVRPGIDVALRAAADAGLPMAVVSNTLCGAAHRDFLTGAGLGRAVRRPVLQRRGGVRKPNPELARAPREAVGRAIGRLLVRRGQA